MQADFGLHRFILDFKKSSHGSLNFEYSEVSPIGRYVYEIALNIRNIHDSELCHDQYPF